MRNESWLDQLHPPWRRIRERGIRDRRILSQSLDSEEAIEKEDREELEKEFASVQ